MPIINSINTIAGAFILLSTCTLSGCAVQGSYTLRDALGVTEKSTQVASTSPRIDSKAAQASKPAACSDHPFQYTPKNDLKARQALKQQGIEWSNEAFFQAMQNGDAKAVSLFLKGGMPPDALLDGDQSIIYYAVANKSPNLVNVLAAYKQAGVDMNSAIYRKRDHLRPDQKYSATLIEMAASAEYRSVIDWLLKNKVDVCPALIRLPAEILSLSNSPYTKDTESANRKRTLLAELTAYSAKNGKKPNNPPDGLETVESYSKKLKSGAASCTADTIKGTTVARLVDAKEFDVIRRKMRLEEAPRPQDRFIMIDLKTKTRTLKNITFSDPVDPSVTANAVKALTGLAYCEENVDD